MAIDFANPWLLLSLIPIIGFILQPFNRNHHKKLPKEKWIKAVRIILVLLLILSLAGISLKIYTDATALVLVADVSDSMIKVKDDMAAFIQDVLKHKTNRYQIGVIAFGKDALVEQPIARDISFSRWETTPNAYFTNIDKALQMAEAIMPSDARKRIVLLTDGAQNMGDAVERARALAQQGVRIDGVFFDAAPEHEVQVTSLEVPSELYEGEAYDIRVVINSTVNTSGILRLYANRKLIGQQSVELQRGENRFVFKDTADTSGIKTYEADLQAAEDGLLDNNRIAAYADVKGAPVVAIVEGQDGEGREITKILDAGNIKTVSYTPQTLPADLDELRKFQGLILCDVSADDLGDDKMQALDSFVKVLGRGLLVTGGDNSYALGDYMGTALEEVLPVSMDLSQKADIPSLGLVLVIDKSGSMSEGQYGITKLELAKEAAMRSTDVLRPKDTIGVVAFDDAASWAVEMQKAGDLKKLQDDIGAIRPGGGTNMYPALDLAYNALKDADTKLKHIIVLTDGQSADGDFEGLVQRMAHDGITLSSVAVGVGADKGLLQKLAQIGNGRYYYTDEFSNIPKIFAKETYLAAQSYLQNRTFYPAVTGYSPVISNFKQGFPPLHGYIATTIKPTANMVMASDRSDPILAEWQYGLGRVLAWTSDLRGAWTEDWLRWDKAAQFWLNAVSRILPSDDQPGNMVEVERADDKGQVTLTTGYIADETVSADAVVVGPDGKQQSLELQADRPGQYVGSFDIDEPGIYLVRVQQQKDGKVISAADSGLAVTYSPEYDIRYKGSKQLLEQIVSQTGGRIIDDPKQVFADDLAPVWRRTELWPYLLPLALMLFILDIALRRLKIEMLWASLAAKLPKRSECSAARVHGQPAKPAVHAEAETVSSFKPVPDDVQLLISVDRAQPDYDEKIASAKGQRDDELADDEAEDIASRLLNAKRQHRRKRL